MSVDVPASAPTQAELRTALNSQQLDGLAARDPVAAAIIRALHTSVRGHAEALVAETLAHALATHLVAVADETHSAEMGPKLSARTLERVTDYMRGHLQDQIVLEDLARQAHLSKYHFLRAFKATVGMTPYRYLTDLRMNRAVELLAIRRHTVATVAAQCGYASAGRFAAVFRQRYGITPGAYQRM